ncbi:MAG: RHS repeat-associated core domain-containing protein [Planctomycetota bacterium]
MQRMVTAPIPLYSPNDITRAQSRAGGWVASFDFDGACTSTPSLPAIASPNESLDDSSMTTSTLTGPFCCNHQDSVTAITTSTGAIAERYAYTAYGQPTILNASGTVISATTLSNRYTYTGREWDATLGLHHFRARWMSPSAGRFLGRDPIGYVGGIFSVYAYVGNNPSVRSDPGGLCQGSINYPIIDPRVNPIGSRPRTVGFVDVSVMAFACTGKDDLKISIWLDSFGENYRYTDPDDLTQIEYFWGCNTVTADRLSRFAASGLVQVGTGCRQSVVYHPAGSGRGGCPTVQITIFCPLSCSDCTKECSSPDGSTSISLPPEDGRSQVMVVNWSANPFE